MLTFATRGQKRFHLYRQIADEPWKISKDFEMFQEEESIIFAMLNSDFKNLFPFSQKLRFFQVMHFSLFT